MKTEYLLECCDRPGTDDLSLALLSFSEKTEQSHSRVIIPITDGEGHDNGAVEVARRAAEQGVRIFTIGIGTPEGLWPIDKMLSPVAPLTSSAIS